MGIGTTNPGTTLDIVGTLRVSSSIVQGGAANNGIGEAQISGVQLALSTAGAARNALALRGSASQTADLQQWQDSAGDIAASMGPIAAGNQRQQFLLYNTLETTPTNYERLGLYADSTNNIFRIDAQNGGTGTLRNLTLQTTGGNVGIGTTAPTYKLSTLNSISTAGSAVSAITNTNTTDSANTVTLRLNTGATSTTTNARFMTFYAGCTTENCAGTAVGNLQLNNNAVQLNSGTADFAERFPVSESTEPGDIIGIGTAGNRKAQAGDSLLGVVSDTAIVVGNSPEGVDKSTNPVVGLVGQVKTKVSTVNGEIKAGDLITASGTPGVGMKATRPGAIIGKALESFSNDGIGKILIYVNSSYADPQGALANLFLDEGGNLVLPANTKSANADLGLPLIASPANNNPASPILSKTEGFNPEEFNQRIATSSAHLDVSSQLSEISSQTDNLNSKVASVEAELKLLTLNFGLLANPASSSAQLGLDPGNATFSGDLSVGGRTTLSDVGITGKMNIGLLAIEGLSENGFATINTTSGPLKIQSDGLNGIDILDGKIVIEPSGNMKVNGEITVKKVNVDTAEVASASLGTAILPTGENQVVINSTAITDKSKVFVTSETDIDLPLNVVSKTDKKSFTVKIKNSQQEDVKFNWWIVN